MNQFQKVQSFIRGRSHEFAKEIGYPVIIRPAYTLGGTGGGICNNEEELIEIVYKWIKTQSCNTMFSREKHCWI